MHTSTQLLYFQACCSQLLIARRAEVVRQRPCTLALRERESLVSTVCTCAEILGNRKLFVLYLYNRDDITYIVRTTAHQEPAWLGFAYLKARQVTLCVHVHSNNIIVSSTRYNYRNILSI